VGILNADKGAAAVNRQHLLDWFEPDELEPCEPCGEQAGLRIEEAGTFICFGCGYIRWAGGETVVDALQGRIAWSTAVERGILELLEQGARWRTTRSRRNWTSLRVRFEVRLRAFAMAAWSRS
jgi:hypothetical protein